MANNSRVNITLGFNADTDQAKRQINDLVNQLRSIQSTPTTLVDDTSLRKASAAAAELQGHLQKAVDVNTGKLDLSRFSASLRQNGKQLSDYRRDLEAIGPTGSQAFLSVAKSIATAETPLLRANKHLNDFLTTMKNTAKWQISSSIMHGFMGAVQQAYGYSQSLNESLNNIRIVTGYSTEQMAEFASQANKAAKALSTTTTDYTNASLIYFQQGLSDEEVQKRTDITVKMANVARDNVDNVSNQLTAIWNNFYEEGGKSLEYYADVMTALGAKTASSTEEIAGGLEKFAAIGDTIGLSYEYAASALATITSNTRQSEEVVGTALKTIFARIQGLNLGETLEDGTSLNKYSEALAKVGVSIFEQNGELKVMDNILDELAARWGTLNSAQQTSLAQTVAGVRQYTQLIALMENWNNGDEDSFMANIDTSRNAEGALNQQADIYADSWEAARDRVKAAQEDVYDSLINDEFFIQLDNTLTPILGFTADLIDGFGGLGGTISMVGGILMQLFAKEAPRLLDNFIANLNVVTGRANKSAVKMQKEIASLFSDKQTGTSKSSEYIEYTGLESVAKMQAELNANASQLSQTEREIYETQIDIAKAKTQQLVEQAKINEAQQEELNITKANFDQALKRSLLNGNTEISSGDYNKILNSTNSDNFKKVVKAKDEFDKSTKWRREHIGSKDDETNRQTIANNYKALKQAVDDYAKSLGITTKEAKKFIIEHSKEITLVNDVQELATKAGKLAAAYQLVTAQSQRWATDAPTDLETYKTSVSSLLSELELLGINTEKYANQLKNISDPSTGFQEISTLLSDISADIGVAEADTSKLDEAMKKLAQTTGIADDKIDDFVTRLKELASKGELSEAAIRGLFNEFQKGINHSVKMSEGLTAMGGVVMNLAGLLSSFNQTWDIMADEEQNWADKLPTLIGLFSQLGIAIPSTIGGVKKLGGAIATASAKSAASIGGVAISATMASAALGILVVAITGLATCAIIAQKNLDNAAEATAEVAEKTKAVANNTNELNKANKSNIETLEKALSEWEETQKNLDNVKSVVDKLTEAYNLQSGALAKLTGNYEDYKTVLQEAKEEYEKQLKQEQTEHQTNTENQFRAGISAWLTNANGTSPDGNIINVTYDGWQTQLANSSYEETAAANILAKQLKEAGLDRTQRDNQYLLGPIGGQVNIDFSFDSTNKDEALKAYEALTAAKKEMDQTLTEEQKANSGIYSQLVKDLKEISSYFEDYKASLERVAEIELLIGKDFSGLVQSRDSIKDLEDYYIWLEEANKQLIEADEKYQDIEEREKAIQSLIDNSFSTNLKQLAAIDKGIQGIAKINPSLNLDKVKKELEKFSDNTVIEILAEVDFSFISSEDQIGQAVQDAINSRNYTANLENSQSYQDMLSRLANGESLTADDFLVMQNDKLINWREIGLSGIEELISSDSDDQITYLYRLLQHTLAAQPQKNEQKLQAIENNLQRAQAIVDGTTESFLKTNVDAASGLVASTKESLSTDKKTLAGYDESGINKNSELYKDLLADIAQGEENLLAAEESLANAKAELENYQDAKDYIENGYDQEKLKLEFDTEQAEKQLEELAKNPILIDVDLVLDANEVEASVNDATAKANAYTSQYGSLTEEEQQFYQGSRGERTQAEMLDDLQQSNQARTDAITNFWAYFNANVTSAFGESAEAAKKVLTFDILNGLQGYDDIAKLIENEKEKIRGLYSHIDENGNRIWELGGEEAADAEIKKLEDFWNTLENIIGQYDKATNSAAKAGEELADAAKKAAEELEQVKWYDKYDAEKPIDNREARLEGDLEQAQALGKQVSQSFVESTAKGLEQALKDRQLLVDEQLSDTKSDIQKEISNAKFGANGDLLNGKELAKSLTKELNDEEAKGDSADEARIKRLEKRIELLNTYNSLMGESIDLQYELNTYTGDTYHLKSLADEVDLYAELEKELTYVDDALEDIRREKNKAYGKDYINNLDKENKAIKQQNELLKQKIQVAKEQIPVQQNDIQIALGLLNKTAQAEFDEATGRLLNGNEIRMQLAREMASQQEGIMAALNAGNIALANQLSQAYENSKKLYEQVIATLDALAATEQLIIDTENTIEDNMDQILSNNSEMWRHKIEVEIQIDDNDLEIIDKKIALLGDNLYSMAEAAGLILNKLDGDDDINAFSGLGKAQEQMDDIKGSWEELDSLFRGGQITQKDFVDNAQMLFDQVSGNIDKLMDIDKEMIEYYSKAIDAANEQMDYYISQLEHFSSVLDHYRNIVEIVNGEYDYERTGAILEGRVKTLQNEMKVSEDYYAMLKREQEAAKAALASATGEKEKELLEANLKAITEAVIEAEEEMLSKTEEWAEATKELMENTMAKAARAMEMAFTDGLTFDFLSDSMDRLSTYQDEYLTKTNQMYETEKLMRTAQQAADKTQNKVAKEKLQGYIKETTELQNKNKLSKLELEIQQAKYDILVAEIALEEAQNAKSTVRLQRDSEGNFGYVYTADSEKISQAEQDLADAENDLYNIGLDAANDYGQKRIELQQKLADDLIALEERRVNGEFETEEDYYQARDQLIAEYTDLFTAYSNQYTTAMGADANIQEEAWVTSYQNIIDKTNMWSEDSNAAFDAVGQGIGEWKNIVDGYLGECETAYGDWRAVVETESQVVQQLLTDTQGAVDEVTKASDELATEVTTVVIPGIEAELSAVREITTAYGTMRDEVDTLADAYVKLLGDIEAAISAAAGMSDITIPEVKFDDGGLPPNVTDNGDGGGDSGSGGGNSGGSGGNMAYAQSLYWQGKVADLSEAAQIAGSSVTEFKQAANYLASQTYGEGKDRWFTSEFGANLPANYAQQYNSGWEAIENNQQAQDRINEILGFDTGGYTGSWGPEGRLAFLHQKELILKPEDTQNFLAATGLLRDIAGMIDLQAMYSQMTSPTASTVSSSGGFFEQSVHIEASFPAVQDRNEIQEAFNNLLNTASQYANRK